MTLVLLTTSCAPGRTSVSSQSADTNLSSSNDWSDVAGNSGGENSCGGMTRQHSASVNHDSNVHSDNSCQHHHHASSSSSSSVKAHYGQAKIIDRESQRRHSSVDRSSAVQFIDKLQALPLQCDITIVPRVPPHPTATSDLSSVDAANEDDSSSNSIGDDQDDVIQPIRITKQNFHPCGLDNIVRLDGTTVPEEFILTLANCSVRIDKSNNENAEEMIALPVQAVPSSFSFPSSNTFDTQHDANATPYSYSSGEKHNVEEVAVSFDFSMAMDMYQRQLETSEAAVTEELNHNDRNSNPHVYTQSWNADDTPTTPDPTTTTTTNNNIKTTMKINSIMSTLEKESQFIKKTLFVLGSFGCVFLMCMVWTIWKLERGRRSVRRSGGSRVQVKKVFVDNVPCEFIGTTTNAASSTSMTNKSRSLRSNVGRAHFLEEISPIRSLTSLDEAKEVEQAASGNNAVMHDTLHLITPQDVTCNSSSRSKSSKNDDKGQKSSSSPRHWYEDFLSPKGCSKKAPRNRSDDAVIISEHEEVARSLFTSDSNKVSPSVDNKDSIVTSKGATTSTTSVLNAPKKKVLVSPIERSLSPPPSDVSLLKLSNDIEMSSKSPLMISTETEETHDSSTRGDLDEPSPSAEVVDKGKSGIISPTSSMPITEESSNGPTKPVCTPINTPKPKHSRALKTPATDISISSQESHTSSSRKARKIFAQELAKKAWMTPPNSEKSDFSTSIARRAAEVQTPKKTLTPLSADSSLCDDEPSPFLADYW